MLSRPFIILYASVFVGTMGISMVSPLLPVYAEELGATGIWIGLTFSAFAITQTLFGPAIGRISDRHGRKPFIVVGLLIYFTAAIGYLMATSFYQVILLRAMSGVGTACIFAVARAYIGDMVPPGHEGRWFGMFSTADIIGFGIGPLIAGAVRQFLGFDAVFVSMAALMLAAAGIVAALLPWQQPRRAGWEGRTPDASFIAALRDRMVAALSLNMALLSVTFGATFSFLAVLLEDRMGIGPALMGVAFAMSSLAAGISQPIFGRFADLYNRRLLVTLGLAASAVALLGVGAVPAFWVLLALLFLMGIGEGLTMVATSAMQVVAGRSVGMGTVIGLGAAGQGVGIVFGSIAGGTVVDAFGLEAAFVFAGLTLLAGVPAFVVLTHGQATHEDEMETVPDGRFDPIRGDQPAGGADQNTQVP